MGSVLRAEVETTLDGTTVTALLAAEGQGRGPVGRADRDPRHPAAGARRQRGPRLQGQAPPGRGIGRAAGTVPADPAVRARIATVGATARSADAVTVLGGSAAMPVPVGPAPVAVLAGGPARPGPADASRAGVTIRVGWPRRPPTATRPWPPSSRNSSRWPSSSFGAASPRSARPSRSRTPGPGPRAGPRSPRARCWPWPSSFSRCINLATWKDRASVARGRGQGRPAPRAAVDRGLVVDGDPRRGGRRDGHRAAHLARPSGSPPCANAGSSGSPARSTTDG